MKQFIPYSKIGKEPLVIVDALHPHHLVFSHWKGANTHTEIAADSSGEIVLNAISQNFPGWDCPRISASHFDIDGFVGVFALCYPKLAMQYKALLTEMAQIGDFRHFKPNLAASRDALKACIWMNKLEAIKFYRPFENPNELEDCVPKFNYFLASFPVVLNRLESVKEIWEEEYEKVLQSLEKINKRTSFPNLGLIHVQAQEAIPYYALFSETEAFDLVYSSYPNQRYEVEYKYTSWIDLASRPSYPRIDLKPLAEKLNTIEKNGFTWSVDGITDTGPILRLEKDKLSKAERFANPDEREIYPSSISEKDFSALLLEFLKNKLEQISPAYFWTWKNLKKINSQ